MSTQHRGDKVSVVIAVAGGWLMRRSCERALSRRKHLIIFLLLLSSLFSLWLIIAAGSAVDKSRLEQVQDKLPLPLLEQQYDNSLQSTDEVARNNSSMMEDRVIPLTYCEIVHVAIVVAGYNTSRDVVTLIKSILHYQQSPLHFHFMSDNIATHILSTLFTTWQLPSVNVSFYPVEQYAEKVAVVQNVHYSGIYGLMKLILTEALPASLSQVIVLDTDITFTTDIAQLWLLLSAMKEKNKLLGLVENQSDWYLGTLWKKYKPWPAIGRGYNTGVMLMDLGQLRAINWYRMWSEVVLKQKQVTSLADQDIINTLIKHYPHIHYVIPCYWNVQLSEHTLSEECYHGSGHIKVIHWNSPLKTNVVLKHVQYFRQFYNIFTEMDGSHLRAQVLYCNHSDTVFIRPTQVNKIEQCWEFRQYQVYRTHPYFTDYHYHQSSGHPDVTLVAQLSSDRVQMLEALAEHWEGPMSLALFLSDSEAQQFLHFALHSPVISKRRNIGFHIVYKSQYTAGLYPVNYLRNVALDNVNTDYVFLTDIDFLPSYGICDYLRSLLMTGDDPSHKNAFVIPAFETLRYRLEFPIDKANVLTMLDKGLLHIFRYDVWRKGHAATDYNQWRTASQPYMVDWAMDYEPYVVVRSDVPRYDTQFVGFGWNKVSHIMKLDAMGYKFHVLPEAFIIHMPHSPSLDIIKFRSSPHYRDCLQQIKEEFQRSLVKQFGTDAFKYLIT